MKKLIIPIGVLLVSIHAKAQFTNTQNYIQTRVYLEPVTQTTGNAKQNNSVQYFDGLGRLKQLISIKSSPKGNDVVLPVTYDGFGNQTREYLPVPQSGTQNGTIYAQSAGQVNFPVGDPQNLYANEKAFSEKIPEPSPLGRIKDQIQVGNDWQNKPVKFEYGSNSTPDQVKKFTVTTNWDNEATKSDPPTSGFYLEAQLYKNTITDEDGNKTIEFTNDRGQIILVRKVISDSENADTYYVYNEFDQLVFVVPPLLSKIQNWTPEDRNNFAFEYSYDRKGRLVEKKLPGKGKECMVYDNNDRLVLYQDANLKGLNKWLITKYDYQGRTVYTGFLTGGERAGRQNEIKDLVITESRSTTGFNRNGMTVYYTDNYFVGEIPTILTVNYYDSYPQYGFNPAFPTNILGESVLTETPNAKGVSIKGLSVMSLVKNVEDDNWTKSYLYYDSKGRAIGTHSINYLGGYTHTESKLDFAGVVQNTVTTHVRTPNEAGVNIKERFVYDSQNRLKERWHKIEGRKEELIAANTYNELSQLESKKVGGVSVSYPLQQIDYKYNIRGWMTHINDPANLGSDLFGYKINYNKVEGKEVPNNDYLDLKVKPKYNGNIAEVSWKTLTEVNEPLKTYGYVYDPLNRLSAGFYQKAGNELAKEYFERLEYDLNGNVTRLKRSAGMLIGSNTALAIDDLKYDYIGNKLIRITDQQMNFSGYPYTANPGTIVYDNGNVSGNGNMTSHPDKGISSIQYNYLNLPKQIIQSSKVTDYTYRADGTKVKKLFGDIETDYLDGFQYKSTRPSEENSSGGGGIILEPDPSEVATIKLRIIPTSEGYYDVLNKLYVYNYTDHLGNVRLSYADTNQDGLIQPRQYFQSQCEDIPWDPWNPPNCIDTWKPGEIVENNNYYPFGLLHDYTATAQNAYQYKYNGKELQETGMYDYGARMYMSDIARWGVTDPLADK
ncbi:DUF6443 domain-containing protein [Chryseobacterium tructae]|nr:DUF6443 domain-containing protein [Chryseobacterium tructae]MDN3691174.1 DUF6443 domain-containing protein [Chryseobacterium tructae]